MPPTYATATLRRRLKNLVSVGLPHLFQYLPNSSKYCPEGSLRGFMLYTINVTEQKLGCLALTTALVLLILLVNLIGLVFNNESQPSDIPPTDALTATDEPMPTETVTPIVLPAPTLTATSAPTFLPTNTRLPSRTPTDEPTKRPYVFQTPIIVQPIVRPTPTRR
jgi:hypothetical protein